MLSQHSRGDPAASMLPARMIEETDTAILELLVSSPGYLSGQMIARKSLSAWVESERVKTWDITGNLKKGNNLIAVEVKNYTANKAAANVWIQFKNGNEWQKEIVSDEYWKAADRYFKNWYKNDFNDDAWPNAGNAGIDWMISRPYFDHDLPSRIEFFSGYNIN